MVELVGLFILLGLAAAATVGLMAYVIARESVKPPRHTAGYAVAWGLPVDPGERGLTWEAWTVERHDGISLPVWEVTTGVDSDLAVVFVHGWGRSRLDVLGDRLTPFDEVAGRLVLYDLRGHGEAGGISRLGHGEHEDLLALLEQLGDGRVLLAGHSMGAAIAVAAAAEAERDRVVGVVAYGPYIDFHASLRGRLASQRLPTRPITDLAMVGLRAAGIRPPDVLPAAAKLPCPLLVLHGAGDTMCEPRHARTLAESAPDGRYVEIPGGGHLDLHRVDPVRHDDALLQFVGRLT